MGNENIIHYNVWCIEQNKFTVAYGTQESPPTACTDSSSHTSRDIDETKTIVVGIMDPLIPKVLITEEEIPEGMEPTGGHIRTKGFVIEVEPGEGSPPKSTTEFVTHLDINSSVLSFTVFPAEENLGDCMDIDAAKDTVVGVLVAPITDEDTVLPVNSTVIQYAEKGYFICLPGSPDHDRLGYITDIDSVNSTITVQFPPSTSHAAMTPVMLTRNLYENCYIHNTYPIHVGQDKIGGSYVIAGTTMHFTYMNHSNVAKKMYVVVEFLY